MLNLRAIFLITAFVLSGSLSGEERSKEAPVTWHEIETADGTVFFGKPERYLMYSHKQAAFEQLREKISSNRPSAIFLFEPYHSPAYDLNGETRYDSITTDFTEMIRIQCRFPITTRMEGSKVYREKKQQEFECEKKYIKNYWGKTTLLFMLQQQYDTFYHGLSFTGIIRMAVYYFTVVILALIPGVFHWLLLYLLRNQVSGMQQNLLVVVGTIVIGVAFASIGFQFIGKTELEPGIKPYIGNVLTFAGIFYALSFVAVKLSAERFLFHLSDGPALWILILIYLLAPALVLVAGGAAGAARGGGGQRTAGSSSGSGSSSRRATGSIKGAGGTFGGGGASGSY